MKIYKKVIVIFLLSIILLYSIIPPKTAYADEEEYLSSSKEAGQIIADFAKDMVENHASETIYDCGGYWNNSDNPNYNGTSNYGRIQAYNGNKVTGYAQASPTRNSVIKYAENKYFMDCVGFVSFCIHHSLGLKGNSETVFIAPNGIRTEDFEWATGALQPGDILVRSGEHVMIYVGEGYVAEAQDVDDTWQVKRRNSWPTYDKIARIKESSAKSILRSQTKSSLDGQGGTAIGGSTGGGNVADDSSQFDIYIGEGNLDGLGNSNKFYYNGVPRNGAYLGKTKESNWLFEGLANALDWLVGLATMNIKVQAIGWTSIFENVANEVVEAVTLEELTDRITVEDIIYNKVPVLDVNIFNFETAGGQELPEDNIIYMLRQKVASWYVAVRTLSIIILLFTLIYLGIRLAISSIAREKAEYKKKLVGWLVSFIIVMFIHYFMLLVLDINEIAINWIAPDGSTATIYEQMREYAYEIPATKGWTGTIIYVFLVYYLIKMLLFYFKRLLIVYILAIMSPAMGVMYSIQQAHGKPKALGIWMREFAFNVLIQFVHAITYSILMSIILKFTMNVSITSLIPYAVILFAMLNFLLNAEDIIKNIFKIQANSLKSVMETVFDFSNRFSFALSIGSFGYKKAKKAVVNAYENNLTNRLNYKYDGYKVQGDNPIAEATNKEIERLKQQEKEHIMALNTSAIKFAKSQLNNAVSIVTAVPMLYEKPLVGVARMTSEIAGNKGTLNGGVAGESARNLDSNTEGEEYVYIDNPNAPAPTGGAPTPTGGAPTPTGGAPTPMGGAPTPTGGAPTPMGGAPTQTGGAPTPTGGTPTPTGGAPTQTGGAPTPTGGAPTQTGGAPTQTGGAPTQTGGAPTPTGGAPTPTGGAPTQTGGAPTQTGGAPTQTGGAPTPNGNSRNIRTYNTKKNRRFTGARMLSWATVGRSTILKNAYKSGKEEQQLIENVYSSRIKKLSVIGNQAVKEMDNLNTELEKVKTNTYPPIYYTPKSNETEAQIAMNEKLREKYRKILEKNIKEVYGGVDKDRLNDSIINYKEDKVTLKSVEDIAKDYLNKNECYVGKEFNNNFDKALTQRIIDTAQSNSNALEKINLKPDVENKILDAIDNANGDRQKLNDEVSKILTPTEKENVVSNVSVKDLTELMSQALGTKGSIEMNNQFSNLQDSLHNLGLLNNEAEVTSGNEMYSTKQIIDLIMNKDIME